MPGVDTDVVDDVELIPLLVHLTQLRRADRRVVQAVEVHEGGEVVLPVWRRRQDLLRVLVQQVTDNPRPKELPSRGP